MNDKGYIFGFVSLTLVIKCLLVVIPKICHSRAKHAQKVVIWKLILSNICLCKR